MWRSVRALTRYGVRQTKCARTRKFSVGHFHGAFARWGAAFKFHGNTNVHVNQVYTTIDKSSAKGARGAVGMFSPTIPLYSPAHPRHGDRCTLTSRLVPPESTTAAPLHECPLVACDSTLTPFTVRHVTGHNVCRLGTRPSLLVPGRTTATSRREGRTDTHTH